MAKCLGGAPTKCSDWMRHAKRRPPVGQSNSQDGGDNCCNIAVALTVVNERNRLIYKRECQGKYSSRDRKRGTFLAFQPLSAMRDARLCCLAPLSLGSCNCSISAAASLLVATTPISL